MEELLNKITEIYSKNDYHDLDQAVNEKKLLNLYAFYHYYNGNEDYILDVIENCPFDQGSENVAQGFFELDDYDEKTLEILVPIYVKDNENFGYDNVIYTLNQVQNLMYQIKNRRFTLVGNNSRLREIWDPSSEEQIYIKVITNYSPDYDNKNNIRNSIYELKPMFSELHFDIVFGDEIVEEITQMSSDSKYVENGQFVLDKPNNYLTYGEENSIITNIKASSLKDNFRKYGRAGLLAKNLRFYVANKKVDEGLENSIRQKGENFWYYNNGIIIVCDDYEINDDIIKLKNFSIVNGGQTTRMIGVIPFSKDFAISCKIIKNKYLDNKENEKFVSEIAEASNMQKPINAADIIANRYEQRILKQKLSDAGVFMQIKRGESTMINLKDNYPDTWQRTKNDELGQLLYGALFQKPGTARNSKAKIFSDPYKYNLVFGNIDYDMDLLKDLLYLKTYYKKWASYISKSEDADSTKKGLVRNGYLYFAATVLLMAKFCYCPNLSKELLTVNINTEKGEYLISNTVFNHRIFKGNFKDIKKEMFLLFELVYDRYISRGYNKLKQLKPDLVYSNFTKTDKNYITTIASDVYDDFGFELNGHILAIINPLFYQPSEKQILKTDLSLEKALYNYENKPEKEEIHDFIADALKERLKEYRYNLYSTHKVKKAYEVFNNKELDEIVLLKPKTTKELEDFGCLKVKSHTKIKKFGNDIVKIINEVCGDKNIIS